MNLELHPDAASNFNTRADSLVSRLASWPGDRKADTFRPPVHISADLTENDLAGEITVSTVDALGKRVGRYFEDGPSTVGFAGDDYKELTKLIEAVQRTPSFRSKISQTLLEDVAFDWFKKTQRDATNKTFSDYILEVCLSEIKEYEVVVPIALLSVERSLPVGHVIIQPVAEQDVSAWFSAMREHATTEEEKQAVEISIETKRRKLQGYCVATLKISADKHRAEEVALEEADAACALLRFFSPGNFRSRTTSYCMPLGSEHIQSFQTGTFLEGKLVSWRSAVTRPQETHWVRPAAEIDHIRTVMLDVLSELYKHPNTDFHKRITDAILLYSKVSVTPDLSGKLVILLAALESLLLRNANETIQQNLGERLSLIGGKDLTERKQIVALTRNIYSRRSRFLHHAEAIDDVATLDSFLVYAWQGFFNVVANRDKFQTLEGFLEKVDDLKLR